MADDEYPEQAPPATEQEQIAFLRGKNVPGRDGTFGGTVEKNGEEFDIEVFKADGTSAGTARGKTEAEIVAKAQALLDED